MIVCCESPRKNLERLMELIKVCDITELSPGEMKAVDINGEPVLAVYNIGGEFCVTSNVCTHEVALLSDGYLDGAEIECPVHGGRFNVKSGEAIWFPCETPLCVYKVSILGDEVFANVDEMPTI